VSELIENELGPKRYFTKTQRVRHLPAARPVARASRSRLSSSSGTERQIALWLLRSGPLNASAAFLPPKEPFLFAYLSVDFRGYVDNFLVDRIDT